MVNEKQKTPEEVAADIYWEADNRALHTLDQLSGSDIRELMQKAVEADRAQREERATYGTAMVQDGRLQAVVMDVSLEAARDVLRTWTSPTKLKVVRIEVVEDE